MRKLSTALATAACTAVGLGAQQPGTATSRSVPHKDPVVATVLSFVVPGAGQLYVQRYGKAITVFGGSAAATAIAIGAHHSRENCSSGGSCGNAGLETGAIVVAVGIWGYGWITAGQDARMRNSLRLNSAFTPFIDARDGRLLAGLTVTMR